MSGSLAHEIVRASGTAVDNCCFVAHRYDKADGMFRPGQGESFVCTSTPERLRLEIGGLQWFTAIWQAEDHTIFVSDVDGQISILPEGRGDDWEIESLPATIAGLWGLNSRCIWAWGLKAPNSSPALFRFDGKSWQEVPSPGEIVSIHGIHPDLMFAVGYQGLIAKWNGRRWSQMQCPVHESLNGVCAISENEAYATTSSGFLLEGSAYGWAVKEKRDHRIHCVAHYHGTTYVGAPSPVGLLKVAPGGLEEVDPQVAPYQMDTRGELLCATPYSVASTTNGKDWHRIKVEAFERMVSRHPPSW